jgi:hypothetical protein
MDGKVPVFLSFPDVGRAQFHRWPSSSDLPVLPDHGSVPRSLSLSRPTSVDRHPPPQVLIAGALRWCPPDQATLDFSPPQQGASPAQTFSSRVVVLRRFGARRQPPCGALA